MDYRIAIPSYKRSKAIKEKTLNYILNVCKIEANLVDVFVANEKEYEDYKYLQSIGINIIIGVVLLHRQRNFIQDYYEENQCVIQIDDDIDCLKIKKG